MSRAITSLANETVKQVRALHLRKAREETGLFLVEGLRSVLEGVELGARPRLVLYGGKLADHGGLARAANAADDVAEVSPAVLAKISRRDNPQMVLGVFHQASTPLDALAEGVLVGLEGVRDPGNLGSIIRTIDAAGGAGLILIGATCDPYSVEAVRATMGSIFAVPVATVTQDQFLAWRAAWPGRLIGTSLAASADFRGVSYQPPCLILLGAEQSGLTPLLAAACDDLAKIPMRGRADSLNLAAAAAVMLYAATA